MDEFLANINVLSWITFTPLIGMAVVLCLPRTAGELVKRLTLLFTGIPLVLASMMWCVFERGTSAMQFTEDMPLESNDILSSFNDTQLASRFQQCSK